MHVVKDAVLDEAGGALVQGVFDAAAGAGRVLPEVLPRERQGLPEQAVMKPAVLAVGSGETPPGHRHHRWR
ncbi:hypothetical protein [Streptomyces filipinensis]|uniref:hypothetical protein n=1 Tax=Streptomyces filipinensis TaxID=66887 RepID=UPI0017817728|nr:hypothetical protein [Streptomyces filipinensis]